MLPHDKRLTGFARYFRKNMTPEEKKIWYEFFKRFPVAVKRQHNIDRYIVDFYIPKYKIAVEIDGKQHTSMRAATEDHERDRALADRKIRVIRCSNRGIRESFSSVCDWILHEIGLSWNDLLPIPANNASNQSKG